MKLERIVSDRADDMISIIIKDPANGEEYHYTDVSRLVAGALMTELHSVIERRSKQEGAE